MTRMPPKVLVAGIGNIFKGDDAFGVEVARRLAGSLDFERVAVVDFGIRGHDLAYALLEKNLELAILVDAVRRGGAPGTVYLIDPLLDGQPGEDVVPETHSLDPSRMLAWLKALGGPLPRIRIVGCEPQIVGSDEELLTGLSQPVREAIEPAVGVVRELIAEALCMN